MDPDRTDDSSYFGLWPSIVGFAVAALVIWAMFQLATGFL